MQRFSELLLTTGLPDERAKELLSSIGLSDWKTAWQRLAGLSQTDEQRRVLQSILPVLLTALEEAATPDASLLNLERLVSCVPDRLQLLMFLAGNPRAIEILVKLFVGSQFLTEILLRNPRYLEQLTHHRRLAEFKSREDFRRDAVEAMAGQRELEDQLNALRRFQHWELLRIGACDSFGLLDLKSVTVQLSLLADAIVQTALTLLAERQQVDVRDFAVLAFGKLGGEELNYSSDIDLVFVARDDAGRFWDLGQRLIRALTDSSSEGFLYRVDMRLRPWGRSGPLVTTTEGYRDYLRKQAAQWEKQALLKARPIAGQLAVGAEFLRSIEPLVFHAPVEVCRETVRTMKARIEADLRKHGRLFGEVKSGEGSIRDIEFVTQFLQLKYGRDDRYVRSINTLEGLVHLTDRDCLLPNEYRQLSTAYLLFRKIEHALQLVHGRQVHTLPTDDRELAYVARRLDFPDTAKFLESYRSHSQSVRAIYQKYIERGESSRHEPDAPIEERETSLSHTAVMEPSYAKVFRREELVQHARLLELVTSRKPVVVAAAPAGDDRIQLTVCGFDTKGDLALICGLLFANGFDIVSGHVFTAADVIGSDEPEETGARSSRRKFVNVFTLRLPGREEINAADWSVYAAELTDLVKLAATGKLRDAQGRLARRIAASLRHKPARGAALPPIDLRIDNQQNDRFTTLELSAEDTPGFLYELANSLSLLGFDIHRAMLNSQGNRAIDRFLIAGPDGRRVTDSASLNRLRAAVVLVKHFTHLLPQSPNPEAALMHFGQLLERLLDQPGRGAELASLDRREVLEALTKLLGVSDFLWEDFLRLQHDNLFPVLQNIEGLVIPKPMDQLGSELQGLLVAVDGVEARREVLNAFKDREMFRIDMRHITGHTAEFGQFSEELTDLADVVTEAAYSLCRGELQERFGEPLCDTKDVRDASCSMAVMALGKAGGRELGFASDIELMFVYADTGWTTGPERIPVSDFYARLVEAFTHTIRARRQGVFEVDLRLRPYGNAGPLAVRLKDFSDYFAPGGPAWPYERQALVRMRPVCGDAALGRQIIEVRNTLVYTGERFDVAAMRAMRERQLRQLVQPGTWNAKLSSGGLVDCEYLVQSLQITFGRQFPDIRSTSTVEAMQALHRHGLLPDADYRQLHRAYAFLRRLIDALRMVRGDARDLTVPAPGSDEFEFLAGRLGDGEAAHLQQRIEETAHAVSALFAAHCAVLPEPG